MSLLFHSGCKLLSETISRDSPQVLGNVNGGFQQIFLSVECINILDNCIHALIMCLGCVRVCLNFLMHNSGKGNSVTLKAKSQ